MTANAKTAAARKRRVLAGCLAGCFSGLGLAAQPFADAAAVRVPRVRRIIVVKSTTTTSPAAAAVSVSPAPAGSPATSAVPSTASIPSTTALDAVPAAKVKELVSSGKTVRLVLESPGRSDLTANVSVQAIGIEEGTTSLAMATGTVEQTVTRSLDPDSKYTFTVRWANPQGALGAPDVRVIEPLYPQPHWRGPVPVAGFGWEILFGNDFTPTRRNPCAPIRVNYDPTNAPLDLVATIKDALAQGSAASGIPITLDTIGKPPTDPRILNIGWVTGTTTYLGLARQTYLRDARGVTWRTTMSISLAASRRVATGRWQTVVLHELGHVLGLEHSHDSVSMMFSPVESREDWPFVTVAYNEGDKAGLKTMNIGASNGCSTTIEPADLWNGKSFR